MLQETPIPASYNYGQLLVAILGVIFIPFILAMFLSAPPGMWESTMTNYDANSRNFFIAVLVVSFVIFLMRVTDYALKRFAKK